MFYCVLERKGGERKRERETLTGYSRMCPNQGLNPQPRHVPWLGIEPATLCCTGQRSNLLGHLARLSLKSFDSYPGIWFNFLLPLLNKTLQKHWTTLSKSTWTGIDSQFSVWRFQLHCLLQFWSLGVNYSLITRLNNQYRLNTWKILLYPMVVSLMFLFPHT